MLPCDVFTNLVTSHNPLPFNLIISNRAKAVQMSHESLPCLAPISSENFELQNHLLLELAPSSPWSLKSTPRCRASLACPTSYRIRVIESCLLLNSFLKANLLKLSLHEPFSKGTFKHLTRNTYILMITSASPTPCSAPVRIIFRLHS